MTIWYKQGVCGDLQPVTRKGLGRVADLAGARGEDVFVTSKRDAHHGNGSLHPEGLAFDIRYIAGVSIQDIREALGPEWDVVPEGDHIHCEWDPKGVRT